MTNSLVKVNTDIKPIENVDHGQFVLALFDELSPKELKISDSPSEVGFNRADIFLDLDGISLSGRRAIDVAHFIVAQSESTNSYFSRQEKQEYVTYVVELEFFKWLMGYTSNNRNHLRSVLRQGQKAAIEVIIEKENPLIDINKRIKKSKDTKIVKKDRAPEMIEQWVSVPLMGAVGFNQGYVHFQIHEQLEHHIKNPKSYHFLDLRYIFETLRGRILFDKLQPYIDEGITPWIDINKLRKDLDCDTKFYREYKYFNSRVLVKAVADINKNTGFTIEQQEMLEPGESRKITSVRFLIKRKDKSFSISDHLAQLTDRYTVLIEEFGLNQKQIQSVIRYRRKFDEKRIDNAIKYTRFQIQMGKIKTSPSGYLMKAIEEGYVLGTAMTQIIDQNSIKKSNVNKAISNCIDETTNKIDDEIKQNSTEGLKKLELQSDVEQKELLSKYLSTLGARASASGDKVDIESIKSISDVLKTPILTTNFGLYAFEQIK